MHVCPGLPGAPPFEALSFPTVSFQRCCRPTGAAARTKPANHSAARRLSDSTVGPSTSRCALTSQRGGKSKNISLCGFFPPESISDIWRQLPSTKYFAPSLLHLFRYFTKVQQFKHHCHHLNSDHVTLSSLTVLGFKFFLNLLKTFCPCWHKSWNWTYLTLETATAQLHLHEESVC